MKSLEKRKDNGQRLILSFFLIFVMCLLNLGTYFRTDATLSINLQGDTPRAAVSPAVSFDVENFVSQGKETNVDYSYNILRRAQRLIDDENQTGFPNSNDLSPSGSPSHGELMTRSKHSIEHDLKLLEESCTPLVDSIARFTNDSWPRHRECPLRNTGNDRCVVSFSGGPVDGMGSQIYRRMAVFQDAYQLGCEFLKTPLLKKTEKTHSNFNKLGHGIGSSDVDRTFGLTIPLGSQLYSALGRRRVAGLRRHCPLMSYADLAGNRSVEFIAKLRHEIKGSFCVDKKPLLHYGLSVFSYASWLRGRAVLHDLYVAAPGPTRSLAGVRHYNAYLQILRRSAPQRAAGHEIAICVHVRRGDITKHHRRFVPLDLWRRSLSSVVNQLVSHSEISIVTIHIITESGSAASSNSFWSAGLAESNNTCSGCIVVDTHPGDAADALTHFSALVAADILLISDSGESCTCFSFRPPLNN